MLHGLKSFQTSQVKTSLLMKRDYMKYEMAMGPIFHFQNKIFCHLLHIRSGKTENLFSLLLCSLWWVQIFGYVLACRSYSFVCTVHHLIIITVRTYLKALNLKNACQINFVDCVSKIKHILSVIHYTICGAVCFHFTHFSCDDWENIYTLSYYHHEIGSMNYYPLFRVRSWNNGVRCMSFCILMEIYIC